MVHWLDQSTSTPRLVRCRDASLGATVPAATEERSVADSEQRGEGAVRPQPRRDGRRPVPASDDRGASGAGSAPDSASLARLEALGDRLEAAARRAEAIPAEVEARLSAVEAELRSRVEQLDDALVSVGSGDLTGASVDTTRAAAVEAAQAARELADVVTAAAGLRDDLAEHRAEIHHLLAHHRRTLVGDVLAELAPLLPRRARARIAAGGGSRASASEPITERPRRVLVATPPPTSTGPSPATADPGDVAPGSTTAADADETGEIETVVGAEGEVEEYATPRDELIAWVLEVPGIGASRAGELADVFEDLDQLAAAELADVVERTSLPRSTAQAVLDYVRA